MTLLAAFRQNLRAAMRASPMTAAQICERAGYNAAYVRKVLAGRANPTLLFVECLATAVGTTAVSLLTPATGEPQ